MADDGTTGKFTERPEFGPPTFIVPIGEAFECPCGCLKIGAMHPSSWMTSFETKCLGCGAVVVMDGGQPA